MYLTSASTCDIETRNPFRSQKFSRLAIRGSLLFKPGNTKFAWEKPLATPSTPRLPTTTEDIVIFDKDQKKVELDIPDELFGSGFGILTNLSQTVGDYMINTALRTQRVLETMRPFLRAIFGAKGIVIEATTDKPIFSDPNMKS